MAFGAVACYLQMDSEENDNRADSAKSDMNLTNPKVQAIEVISDE